MELRQLTDFLKKLLAPSSGSTFIAEKYQPGDGWLCNARTRMADISICINVSVNKMSTRTRPRLTDNHERL